MTDRFDPLRALGRALAGPVVSTTLVLGAVATSGFVAIGLAWRGAAGTPYVPFEVPFVVSGGLGGLALLVFALGLLDVHANRVESARRHAQTDAVLRQVVELVALAPTARRRRSEVSRSRGAGRG